MLEKWPFLDQNHGLTPLQKSQFFDFLKFLFLEAKKGFFLALEYCKRHFPGLYRLKRKVLQMAIFGQKAWVNLLEKCQFFDCLNFVFL